jgi:hypothetical protein
LKIQFSYLAEEAVHENLWMSCAGMRVSPVYVFFAFKLGRLLVLRVSLTMPQLINFSFPLVQEYAEILRRDIRRRLEGESGQDKC